MTNGVSALGSGPRRKAAAALLLDAVTAEVLAAMETADVPAVLLKGPALATWLYGATEFRPYADIDLIVPPARRQSACRVLAGLGFTDRHAGTRAGEVALHSDTWARSDGVEVDLHVTLPYVTASPDAVWQVMSRDAGTMLVGGRTASIPSEGARALVVAVKAIAGGRADVRSMDDLARAVERIDVAVWEHASRLATELAAGDVFAAGLRLLPEGAALAERLELPVGTSPRLHVLGEVDSDELRVAALRWARLEEAGGPARRLRFLATELLPSRASLASAGTERSPAVGRLTLAYVRRLSRIARTMPAGYVTWQAARREMGVVVPFVVRLEVFLWAQIARALIRLVGVDRTLRVADLLPRGRPRKPAAPLQDFGVRRTTCLHRSIGRSQYMRRRGVPHEVILGVAGCGSAFCAHAWVEPPDPEPDEFAVIHRMPR